jgi:hypothetical protein
MCVQRFEVLQHLWRMERDHAFLIELWWLFFVCRLVKFRWVFFLDIELLLFVELLVVKFVLVDFVFVKQSIVFDILLVKLIEFVIIEFLVILQFVIEQFVEPGDLWLLRARDLRAGRLHTLSDPLCDRGDQAFTVRPVDPQRRLLRRGALLRQRLLHPL